MENEQHQSCWFFQVEKLGQRGNMSCLLHLCLCCILNFLLEIHGSFGLSYWGQFVVIVEVLPWGPVLLSLVHSGHPVRTCCELSCSWPCMWTTQRDDSPHRAAVEEQQVPQPWARVLGGLRHLLVSCPFVQTPAWPVTLHTLSSPIHIRHRQSVRTPPEEGMA